MENISELVTSIQKILNSPVIIHSYNIISKFIGITSSLMDKIAEALDKIIEKHGNSEMFLYKVHLESNSLFYEIPWPKVILVICLSLLFIKIIQTAFSWLYKSIKFMMKSLIISVAISLLIVWLLETSTQKFSINDEQ
ncbi:hypothetical protein H8356DRAFT_1665314 [Neocallimastix lanati (nom. inval.)]|uniref:Uncharacterized protein n=1 Tax=Neocallimastix californiae TaxID=1754190 RepID=A0A1Y2FC54_9FUNG|nr:hypothetical protein H8356DRAFT_1665314 [Neocallimastix sp. JGI-2020a]ORY81197.1 hypothetical protein LY90DRAFT_620747 [Neocallimastix californiae]|eukprot:ORY81197.1 hypothetical protein LY90DRAFT_620747 [Neocallimastix californiae]